MKEAEQQRLRGMMAYERDLADGRRVAGMDEVGRGPWAGPVCAACVIMPDTPMEGIKDSKKISEKRREQLAEQIQQAAVAYGIGFASEQEIEQYNILEATKLAMRRAWEAMAQKDAFLIIDALQPDFLGVEGIGLVKADAQCYSVAAASILAKVTRDRLMIEYDRQYPMYGFAKNKGYGTTQHQEALQMYGACPIHRPTFIRNWVK